LPAALSLVGYGLGRFAIDSRATTAAALRCLAVNQVISLGMAAVGVSRCADLAFAPAAADRLGAVRGLRHRCRSQ
jgi:hypothetical protein